MKKFKILLFIISISLFISGCELIKEDAPTQVSEFDINITGLPVVTDTNYEYNLWSIDAFLNNGREVLTRIMTIKVDQAGNFVGRVSVPNGVIQSKKHLFISLDSIQYKTVVDTVTNDSITSRNYVVGSRLVQGLIVANKTDFQLYNVANPSATVTIITPSDADPNNEQAGVWFVKQDSTGIVKGLNLPVLPKGLKYTAWLKVNNQTLSLGSFTDPNKKDDANTYSANSLDTVKYHFPGEDFITNLPAGLTAPLNLANAVIFITVETEKNISVQGPSNAVVFEGTIPAIVTGGTSVILNYKGLPKASINFILQI